MKNDSRWVVMAATLAVVVVAFFVSAGVAGAQTTDAGGRTSVPRLVQFNGTLKDTGTRPVSGVASVTFAIYAEQDGGDALWSETQNVLADAGGHFNALLGTSTSGGFPSELFSTGQSRWLGVTIARQPEMARVMLASVPYAMKAGDADTLGGLPASSYVTAQQLAAASGSTGGGRNSAEIISAPSVTQTPVEPQSAATDAATNSITQASVTGSGTTNFVPLWKSGSNLANSILFQTNGRIGVGTTVPAVTLDVNGDAIFRGSFQLVPQGTATAKTGQLSHSYQWEASTFNSSTNAAVTTAFGFRATPQGNDTANPTSSLDLYYGPGGGTLADTGLSISNAGVITFAPGQTFNGLNVDTVGSYNTGVGLSVLGSNTGFQNTALGAAVLSQDNGASNNTGVGFLALGSTTSGGSNVAIGSGAGYLNIEGGNNTLVGAFADVTLDDINDATAIGAYAKVAASNSMVLGGTGANSVGVGINTTTPAHTLDVIDRGLGSEAIFATSAIAGDSAILAENTSTTGLSNGGMFRSSSPNGSALVAVNESGGYAGFFEGNNYAGYFQGNVTVTGTLTKGGGSFKIDDPIDPAGKYLSHSFVESPDMMNVYNGTVTLDAHGRATVRMPAWFDALNRDFQYQLTAIGRPGPKLYIAEKVHDNEFRIAGGKAGMEVSWMVTGIRQDAWANAHRIPNEEVKPAEEQGKYLHPELYGAGPEKSVVAVVGGAASGAVVGQK